MLRAGILRILKQNEPLVNDLYGSLSNISVKNKYSDAMNELKKKDEYYNGYKNYLDINNKLSNYQLTDEDKQQLLTPSEKLTTELNNPVISGTQAYNTYLSNADRPDNYIEYLKSNHPELYQEYLQNGTIQQQQNPITESAVNELKYKRLGINPEDIKTYEKYKSAPFDYEKYNRELESYGLSVYPNLISTGSLGNTLANLYAKQIEGHLAPAPVRYKTRLEEGKQGDIYTYREDNPEGTFKVIRPGTTKPEKEDWKPYSDLSYQIFKDEDGTYKRRSYFYNSKGENKEVITPSTEEEYNQYMDEMKPKPEKTVSGSRYYRRSSTSTPKPKDELNKVYYGEGGLDEYLKDLYNNIMSASPEELEEIKSDWQNEADNVWSIWGQIKAENPNISDEALNKMYGDIKSRMEVMGNVVMTGKKRYGRSD